MNIQEPRTVPARIDQDVSDVAEQRPVRPDAGGPPKHSDGWLTRWLDGLTFSTLLPVKAWYRSDFWRQGVGRWFLLLALAPWVILHLYQGSPSVNDAAWAFSGYFAVLWAMVFFALIRPGPLDRHLAAKVILASAIVGVPPAIVLENNLDVSNGIFSWIFGVGAPEEVAKALPVFVLMYMQQAKGKGT